MVIILLYFSSFAAYSPSGCAHWEEVDVARTNHGLRFVESYLLRRRPRASESEPGEYGHRSPTPRKPQVAQSDNGHCSSPPFPESWSEPLQGRPRYPLSPTRPFDPTSCNRALSKTY